jgi:hypothetical protein
MVAHDIETGAIQRGPGSHYLSDDGLTFAILLDHALNAPDLPLYSPQTGEDFVFAVQCIHHQLLRL